MDVGSFVQENKRWLIGCAIGGVVWMIASSVIESMYSHRISATPKGALSEAYKQPELDAAQAESQQLAEELASLKRDLAFVVAPQYSEWSGDADQHLFLQGRNLKRAVVDAASDRDVLVEEKSLVWEPKEGLDQIKALLFGLDMMDEIQKRLFAAHDQTKQQDEDALGLYEIDSIKLESSRGPSRRPSRRTGVDLDDWLTQQTISLQFQSDEPTLTAFLESCRQQNRTLVLDRLDITKPPRPGEPSTVKATLSGISFLK